MAFQYSLRIVGFRDWTVARPCATSPRFQYSLRIVGFRDRNHVHFPLSIREPFSIPCESWGSATLRRAVEELSLADFQYSLRIVGFRDPADPVQRGRRSAFQYSLRIVGFRD